MSYTKGGLVSMPYYYAVEVSGAHEDFELYFPCYELPTFAAILAPEMLAESYVDDEDFEESDDMTSDELCEADSDEICEAAEDVTEDDADTLEEAEIAEDSNLESADNEDEENAYSADEGTENLE